MRARATVLVGAALLVACGGGGGTAPTTTPTPSPTAATVAATFWFLVDTPLGFRLMPEVHAIEAPGDVALSALRVLVDDGLRPDDPDLASPWAEAASSVISIGRRDTTTIVDLRYGHLNVGAEAEALAIAQIVRTVASADPTIESVALRVDGERVETLAGHVDASQPFPVADTDAALATVWISEPTEGATVTGELTFGGEACTFEAAVPWQVLRDDGTVVASGTALAAEACPARSSWSAEVGALPPGSYVVRAYDLSARDGSLIVEDTKDVTVA